MITAADVSAVTKPWSYQANIDQLVYMTYNDVMTDTVGQSISPGRNAGGKSTTSSEQHNIWKRIDDNR